MTSNIDEISINLGKMSKKYSKNGTIKIPMEALGFKAKVFYDSNYEFVPRKRQNKFLKFDKQKRQQNFRSRLTCVVDPSHATYQQVRDMKFNKRSQWKKIKYVIFRTKQQLTCTICLSKQFIAPQMTFCGHVFCWHCLQMHYDKSLKATSCPICNEIFEITELKTCINLFLPSLVQGDRIKFKLKTRILQQKVIFDPQALQQQTQLSRVIRMKNENIFSIYQTEQQSILQQMKKNQDNETQKYLSKVLQQNQNKINQLSQSCQQQKSLQIKHHKHECFINGILKKILPSQQLSSQKLFTFYQQQQGRYAYLHPICQKYILKNFNIQQLPVKIQGEVLLKEQTQYSNQNIKKYKYLNHLPQNQDFDFVFIRMNDLVDYKLLQEFEKQFEIYKRKKQEIINRQQQKAKILNEKYQKERDYLRQLKKMELSEFNDIIVPTNMIDLSQIHDSNIFPSLVQSSPKTQDQNQKSQKLSQKSSPIEFGNKKKNKANHFVVKQQQFPGLHLEIKSSLNEQKNSQQNIPQQIIKTQSQIIKPNQNTQSIKQNDFPKIQGEYLKMKKNEDQQDLKVKRKGKKKNKQKFVDMTHHFFQKQDDYQ